MLFAAFDTATTTGWAVPEDKRYISGIIHPDDWWKLECLINDLKLNHGMTHAVVEDPYLDKNVHSLKVMEKMTSRVEYALERYGVHVIRVKATVWQNSFSIHGDTKLGAMRTAKQLGGDPANQDEADAICMCAYANSRCNFDAHVKERIERTRQRRRKW